MIIPQKYTDGFILWCVTIAAVTVAVSKFIYRAWIENDVNSKIAAFLYTTATVTRNIADVVINETSPIDNWNTNGMIDLDNLTHEQKEALSEDCEDYLVHRHIPLHSHSYDNIIDQAMKEGYQIAKFDREVRKPDS